MGRLLVPMLALLVTVACGARHQPPTFETSGFLDDYSLLRPGVALVYRDRAVHLTAYDKVIFEPVTLWLSRAASWWGEAR